VIGETKNEAEETNKKLFKYLESNDKFPVKLLKERIIDNLLIPDLDIEWLKQQSLYSTEIIDNERWAFVHGGFAPDRKIEQNKKSIFAYLRYVDKKGKPSKLEKGNSAHWTEMWHQNVNVVYGHFVHNLESPHITTSPISGKKTYGIDTGGVFGGTLSALILPERKIVQVQCKKYIQFLV
jgi:hypothetical protein